MEHTDRISKIVVCASLIGLVAGLVGCDGQASRHTSTSTNSTSGRPTSPEPQSSSQVKTTARPSPTKVAETEAIASYLGMWQGFATAGHTSDWKSPLLGRDATGDALLQMSRGLYADHLNGYITKGAPVDHPTVKSATPTSSPTTVLISDCGDSSHWLKYVAKTGRLATPAPGGRQAITAEAKRQSDGTWKIDQFAVLAVGSCT
jgi:hypothetical protein